MRALWGPKVNLGVIMLCHRYGALGMPGALTPIEILKEWEWGADIVKAFPADSFGPA
jgi:2-dehydro-3-deoxyphosphogluconate aldolase/(4S)-4-hydroxy-2-oxoglutarate aldolase